MKQKTNKMLIFTSLAAYFTYFIHGIGASILGHPAGRQGYTSHSKYTDFL